jgi:hypothetical protein
MLNSERKRRRIMGIRSKNGHVTMRLNEKKDARELTSHFENFTHSKSRKYLFSIVPEFFEDLLFELTPEEEADILEWGTQTIRQIVEDHFISRGLTWSEMEKWVANCYRMNLNPLPILRKLLVDIPVYYEDDPDSCPPYGLSCICEYGEPLVLLAHGTLEELACDLVQRRALGKRIQTNP